MPSAFAIFAESAIMAIEKVAFENGAHRFHHIRDARRGGGGYARDEFANAVPNRHAAS
jgi:hypothetical protein